MRYPKISLLMLSLFLVGRSNAHVRNSHLIVNRTLTPEWLYVRDVSEDPAILAEYGEEGLQYPKRWPMFPFNISDPNFRCGRDAWMPRPNGTARLTQTADVLAGSQVGFRLGAFDHRNRYGPRYYHKGPGQIYLARAPDTVPLSEWDGDGDWFKIAYAGAQGYDSWALIIEGRRALDLDWNFTIPKTTPPGKYLMRFEHIFPHEKNETQLWANCAQINVIGEGGGTPTEFARFPGTYQMDDPGIRLPDGTKVPGTEYWDNTNYKAPGPPVWKG